MKPWEEARGPEGAAEGLGEEEGDEPDELELPDESPEAVTDDDIFSKGFRRDPKGLPRRQ